MNYPHNGVLGARGGANGGERDVLLARLIVWKEPGLCVLSRPATPHHLCGGPVISAGLRPAHSPHQTARTPGRLGRLARDTGGRTEDTTLPFIGPDGEGVEVGDWGWGRGEDHPPKSDHRRRAFAITHGKVLLICCLPVEM